MASELKPWRYEIKYGPDGEDNYSWVYDDQGVMVAPMRTHKAKLIVDAMNTCFAFVIIETGLETAMTVRVEDAGDAGITAQVDDLITEERGLLELVTRSQVEELLAAKEAGKL